MSKIQLETVDSTNLWAKMHLDSLDDKTIISANRQTKGRGRFDRVWMDLGDDNIFMSIVLKPAKNFSEIYPNLTQYLCVVVCKILENYGLEPKIKWPNDVLVDGKKICGILSETVTQGSNLKGIVLGIGFNVNSNIENLSKIKDKLATALNIELKTQYFEKCKIEDSIINEFFNNYDEFLKYGFQYIKEDYLKRACFMNKEISVQVFNEKKSGIVTNITDSGELVLNNDNNDLIITMGDIL